MDLAIEDLEGLPHRELILADGTSYGMFGSQQGAGAQ